MLQRHGDAEIAADAFPSLARIEGSQARTAAFIDALADLSQSLKMPTRLREVGIPEDAIVRMARDAMKQTRLLVNNPREVCESDAVEIYRKAW